VARARDAEASGWRRPAQEAEEAEGLHGGAAHATITEPATVHKILSHLGLPTEPPPRAPARDPTGQESFDFEAA